MPLTLPLLVVITKSVFTHDITIVLTYEQGTTSAVIMITVAHIIPKIKQKCFVCSVFFFKV